MQTVIFAVGGLIAFIGVLFFLAKYLGCKPNWNVVTSTPGVYITEAGDPRQNQSSKASENTETVCANPMESVQPSKSPISGDSRKSCNTIYKAQTCLTTFPSSTSLLRSCGDMISHSDQYSHPILNLTFYSSNQQVLSSLLLTLPLDNF